MTMAHGLEARAPFLDHKLAEFCASIPSRFKIRGIQRRYIQMKLAKRYLPEALLRKKKQGFSSALPYMLEDEFKRLYKIFLNKSSLVRAGYLKQGAINSLLNEHLNKKFDHGNRLWLLVNAEAWYRMHIQNESREDMIQLLNAKAASHLNPSRHPCSVLLQELT